MHRVTIMRGVPSLMELAWQSSLLLVVSVIAGLIGSLTGLGGGVVIVPLLVLGFGVDLPFAVATSLVAVVATSSGATAAYLRDGFTNVRIAIVLEVATVGGALVGAMLAAGAPQALIFLLFGGVAVWSALNTLLSKPSVAITTNSSPLAERLGLQGTYPSQTGEVAYGVRGVGWAMSIMFAAGILSAMVGIGSGIVKVLAMDKVMKLPFKVSTTTSTFMIGATAAASCGVYLHRGQLEPTLCGPVALGALIGSAAGARLLPRIHTKWLRLGFALVVGIAGVQMVVRGIN